MSWIDQLGEDAGLARRANFILGIDEVGYGSWAGPLVVGACLAPVEWAHPALRDSKSVKTERGRANVLKQLKEAPGARYFLHATSSTAVDSIGVLKARIASFVYLSKRLMNIEPDTLVIIDGDIRAPGIEHVLLPKADTIVPQVMAAAMVAKVARDTEMMLYARTYPQYGFERHKGYHSEEHVVALEKYGPCPIHRRSYRPIRDLFESSTSVRIRGSGSSKSAP
jgi:ribonuclease HII